MTLLPVALSTSNPSLLVKSTPICRQITRAADGVYEFHMKARQTTWDWQATSNLCISTWRFKEFRQGIQVQINSLIIARHRQPEAGGLTTIQIASAGEES